MLEKENEAYATLVEELKLGNTLSKDSPNAAEESAKDADEALQRLHVRVRAL